MLKKIITLILLSFIITALVAISRNHRIANEITKPISQEITLSMGEKAELGNFSILFNDLIGDSRCPIDVQCIQAGNIEISIAMSVGTKSTIVGISSNGAPQIFEGYSVSIADVYPPRMSKNEIDPKDYKIKFLIKK